MNEQDIIKILKLLQEKSKTTSEDHDKINKLLESVKTRLIQQLEGKFDFNSDEFIELKNEKLKELAHSVIKKRDIELPDIIREANIRFPKPLDIEEILSANDIAEIESRLNTHTIQFNKKYNLDKYDYAIALGCGVFAAMLDLLCVKAPPKPSTSWYNEIDGKFNETVRRWFNKFLPPEVSETLSKYNKIGSADSSNINDLVGLPAKAINPYNHRLRSLSHDPLLGFIFGIIDIKNNTTTIFHEGRLQSIPSTKEPISGNIFQLISKMFGHLLSDVNAPSVHGNRGMGIPAPFMGILRMFDGIPVGDSNFGKQIDWMYSKGYDFRQFTVTSIPMIIMEIMLRCFFTIKQVKVYNEEFGKTLLSTMPLNIGDNHRFRMMLTLAYGTASAINYGKIKITGNILNANYAAWMGLAWNGFHSLYWALYGRNMKFWKEYTKKEIDELEKTLIKIDGLYHRSQLLPQKK